MLLNTLAFLCALLIGFTAHRASLCNVRAVAEVMTSGSTHMLSSLLQAMLWMATLTGVLVYAFGVTPQPAMVRLPLGWAIVGGLLFGVGAALNGGCSLSTLHRMVDGDAGMLATLAGFGAGVTGWLLVPWGSVLLGLEPVHSPWLRWPQLAPWLLALLLLWALLRLRSAARWMRALRKHRLRDVVLAPAYHLAAAAALMGLAGGLLYASVGAWSYTSHVRTTLAAGLVQAPPASLWHSTLVVALLAGMLVSALQRRSLAWQRPRRALTWVRHGLGGLLMGVGAAIVPGGNDTLLLSGLPSASASAGFAYVAMLASISSTLWVLRQVGMRMPSVACSPSGCAEVDAVHLPVRHHPDRPGAQAVPPRH